MFTYAPFFIISIIIIGLITQIIITNKSFRKISFLLNPVLGTNFDKMGNIEIQVEYMNKRVIYNKKILNTSNHFNDENNNILKYIRYGIIKFKKLPIDNKIIVSMEVEKKELYNIDKRELDMFLEKTLETSNFIIDNYVENIKKWDKADLDA